MKIEDFIYDLSDIMATHNLSLEEDGDKFLVIIEKLLKKRDADKERQQKYYRENKEGLDAYHKDYRDTHEPYRRKNSRRATRR